MRQRPKTRKRDLKFASSLKQIDDTWASPDNLLAIKNQHYGMAELWKFHVYHSQTDAAVCLVNSFTRQHPGPRKIVKIHGNLVLHSTLVGRVRYFRCFTVFLMAAADKLANLVRHALGITEWKRRKRDGTITSFEATENNTTIVKLRDHLVVTESDPMPLYQVIDRLIGDTEFKRIRQLANEVKHKWPTHYKGTGLAPPRIRSGGKVIAPKMVLFGWEIGLDFEPDIRSGKEANNLFVDTAHKVVEVLDFDRFYSR